MNRRGFAWATRLPELLMGVLWASIAGGLAAGAWASSSASDKGEPDELSGLRRVIAGVNADWVVAMQSRDAHRAAQAYADDAIFVTRDGAVLLGRDAIERATAERVGNGSTLLDGRLDDDGLQAVSATLVYEWGHSALRWKQADGAIRATQGQFLTVWRRNADGRWEIARNLTL